MRRRLAWTERIGMAAYGRGSVPSEIAGIFLSRYQLLRRILRKL